MPTVTASGHAFLAQIAASGPLASQMDPCPNCFTPALLKPAKKCNGCKIVQYCSKECQRSEWPRHKAICQLVAGNEKVANAFLNSMKPVDVINFVLDMYRYKVLWNEQHLGKLADLLGPKVSPVFHVPKRSILGDRTEADFERFVRAALDAWVLPKYMGSELGIKGCLESAVHSGNADDLFTRADLELLTSKYKNPHIDVALLILAERVVGFDAGGPPQGLKIWMDGFIESFNACPKAVQYVQQIEIDRITLRVAKGNSEKPSGIKASDALRGHEDNPMVASLMENMFKNFNPANGDGAFEQLVAMQKQLAPDDLELQESIQKIQEQSAKR
jgi:hypothetical protein